MFINSKQDLFVITRIVKVECQHREQVVNEPVTHSLFARDSSRDTRRTSDRETEIKKNVKKIYIERK